MPRTKPTLAQAQFFLVWERIKPFAGGIRAHLRNPHIFENLESATRRYEKWAERRAPGYLGVVRAQMKPLRSEPAAR